MNFSTDPPWLATISCATPKYSVSCSRTASASRDSDMVVKPTRSANMLETSFRSATLLAGPISDAAEPGADIAVGSAATPLVGAAAAGVLDACKPTPHSGQNLGDPSYGTPHEGHACCMRAPHSAQNFWLGLAAAPQDGHDIGATG